MEKKVRSPRLRRFFFLFFFFSFTGNATGYFRSIIRNRSFEDENRETENSWESSIHFLVAAAISHPIVPSVVSNRLKITSIPRSMRNCFFFFSSPSPPPPPPPPRCVVHRCVLNMHRGVKSKALKAELKKERTICYLYWPYLLALPTLRFDRRRVDNLASFPTCLLSPRGGQESRAVHI